MTNRRFTAMTVVAASVFCTLQVQAERAADHCAEQLVRAYVAHDANVEPGSVRIIEEGRWDRNGRETALLSAGIQRGDRPDTRRFLFVVRDDMDLIFATRLDPDGHFALNGDELTIGNCLPIPLSSSHFTMSGMDSGDLIAQIDPARYATAAAEIIAAQIAEHGLHGLVGVTGRNVLQILLDRYEFVELENNVLLSEQTLAIAINRIPLEAITAKVQPITVEDVNAPRLRYSKYWECEVQIRVSGRRDGREVSVDVELAVTGSESDRDRVARVWIPGVI